jgi:hypothetical protein
MLLALHSLGSSSPRPSPDGTGTAGREWSRTRFGVTPGKRLRSSGRPFQNRYRGKNFSRGFPEEGDASFREPATSFSRFHSLGRLTFHRRIARQRVPARVRYNQSNVPPNDASLPLRGLYSD